MPRRPQPLQPPDTADKAALSIIQRAKQLRVEMGDRELRRRVRFYDFLQAAWPTMEGRRQFLASRHVQGYCEALEAVSAGEITRLVVNMPPGLAKSITGSVAWPAWDWGPNARPDRRWLCLSYGGAADSPATRDAERCRDLIASAWYQAAWGTEYTLSDTQNAKSYFANDHKGYRISTGLEGTASGQRADIVLIDDPTKMDEESLDAILKPADIYEATLMHRAQDDGAAFVLLMSRLHPDDLAGYFLRQDGWIHLSLPMFFESENRCRVFLSSGRLLWEDTRQVDGEPLHPLMTVAIANARQQQKTRPDIFEAQQQQRPTLRQGQIIQRIDHWVRTPGLPNTLPNHFDEVVITVDCAFKGKEPGRTQEETRRSYVVFQKWGRKGAMAYLLDQVRDHMELPQTCEALVEFCSRRPHQATAKYVEAKANGIGVVQTLRNAVPGLMTTDDDEGVLKEFCKGSKEAKLQAVAPYFKAGQVLVPDDAPWVPEYEHELRAFPKSRFNDQVDATAMAVWRLLYTFEAALGAATVLTPDPNNVGLVAGVFEKAYGGDTKSGESVAAQLGFSGGGGGLDDMMRGAYGR